MSETPEESGLPSRSVSTPETKAARAASRSAESEEVGLVVVGLRGKVGITLSVASLAHNGQILKWFLINARSSDGVLTSSPNALR